ncbi:hypothetical protein SprV_0501863800 [Sparganum proliferum]
MILVVGQQQEKCPEMYTSPYATFVDLMKAFDTDIGDGPREIMQRLGCPERFMPVVRQLHGCMTVRVTDNGAVSEAFAVTNGVGHDCVITPALLCLILSAMLQDAHRDERPAVSIAYRLNGQLFKH